MINDILNKYLNNEKSVKIINYTLDGISTLLAHLKDPQKNFKSLHIAGTNGKGSTAFMLAKILEGSGYKTGLYISPHLLKVNERIKINSIDIDDNSLYRYLSKIDYIVSLDNTINPTYFDILTAAAFSYFSDESVDIAVIETGLGGRLDSTNIVIPEISIITDISKDHTAILGDNIPDIAGEKCGIIKQNIPVVTSNTDTDALNVIKMFAEKNDSRFYSYNRNFFTDNERYETDHFVFDYSSDDYKLTDIHLSLFPDHQIKNAAVVITALNILKTHGFTSVSDAVICQVLKHIEVPGRFQILSRVPMIIYDPAHNFEALNNLIDALQRYFPGKKLLFIISMMRDKADNNTIGLFKNLDVIYYLLNDQRAYIPVNNEFKNAVSDDNIIIELLKNNVKDESMIIFTGTFRLYNLALKISEIIRKS